MEFKRYKLGTIAKTSSGATPTSTKKIYYEGGTIPWINSGELSNPFIDKANNYITKLGFDNSSTKMYAPNETVLLAMYGATAGKAALLQIEACTNQAICAIIPDQSIVDPLFLKYKLDTMYNYLVGLSSGSARDNLSQTGISNLTIDIPSLAIQKRISKVLYSLDRKIALNRAINQNLEALAKQLYDYWFVQFDFPDENGRPYKSSGGAMVWNDGLNKYIPNYWNVLKLSDLLREDRVKQINPQDNPNKVFRHLSFPSLDACGSFYEEKGENIKSNKIVVKDEYVLAAKLNPWIKRIAWGTTDEDLICSTEFVVLNPYDKNLKAFLFLLVNQKPFIDYCTSSSTGTSHSQRRVKPDIMKLYKFPYNEKVAQEFSKQVLPIIEITKKNNEQNRELAMQRDKLLPLLMNGQVSLNSDLFDH